jgi:hypothetical protein
LSKYSSKSILLAQKEIKKANKIHKSISQEIEIKRTNEKKLEEIEEMESITEENEHE